MGKTASDLIDRYVSALRAGDLAALESCFHKDAAIIGTQDGLFVTADRSVFMGFLRGVGLDRHTLDRPYVQKIWENRQGKIGVACLLEQFAGAKTLVYATMLQTAEGWKFISRSFVAHDPDEFPEVNSAAPVKLQ